MRGNGFISVNCKGQALTPEQQLVTMKVAAHYLKSDRKRRDVEFTHELLDGRLIYESSGVFVAYAGNFFRVELGKLDGRPWMHEFLLMRGAEDVLVDTDGKFFRSTWHRDGVETVLADPKITRVTQASLLD